ncbi:MAG: methylated-DNA--[protein]-cysteine S-methyltransferase [Phenylobacterium sp.]|uniref:methylated-DNA--[protein]-cysteine S-methyltransferase n=1 Tax=Phenylobacterium sp. TaxID=1871053 RepID=UPI00271AD10F|nr:methylated-DNA--[protein]-cysteine S-methyltransferase [Phenylobacterium sp.]MDO8902255.1 methylated-DNA--[protein]-cysteine S-methyltransferase [Phenylobacterium sp.]
MPKTPPEPLFIAPLPTPLGPAQIVFDAGGVLRAFDWDSHQDRMDRLLARHYGPVGLTPAAAPKALADPFAAYFDGAVEALKTIAWTTGGTGFQQAVWRALCEIPAGVTWSYGQLAAHIGAPRAVRAVGLANGANPVGLVVPCHRVIGANGTLTGYGGGLDRKRWLLAHEGAAFRLAG